MRPIEWLVIAGAGAIAVLQSPAGRARAGQAAAMGWRYAVPAGARAREAAVRGLGAARERLWTPTPGGPIPCPKGCGWVQDTPSAAVLLDHLRTGHGERHAPAPDPPASAASPAEPARRLRERDTRPQERVTQVAPGVYIGHQIEQAIERIGSHMEQFRAVTRALNAAGEELPEKLLPLLETLVGIQTTIAGVSSLITDVAEHADVEMFVDLRAVGLLYDAASNVMAETQNIRTAMERIRSFYAEEIEVERKHEEGTNVRQLAPKVTAAA